MQSISWYYKRVQKMSLSEILWRVDTLVKQQQLKLRFALTGKVGRDDYGISSLPLYDSGKVLVNAEPLAQSAVRDSEKCKKLIARAEARAENRLDLFNLKDLALGTPIRWRYDFCNKLESEDKLSVNVDYRDVRRNGDCKLVWEPNRHHQLPVLALAYRATGEVRYSQAVKTQLLSWIEGNPYGFGMNWRSPLELGIRLINWVFALDLLKGIELFTEAERKLVLKTVYQQLLDTSAGYSRGSSANNHLIGEAAGVFIGASYFSQLPDADKLVEGAQRILEEEIVKQADTDGCTCEHALGYQFFVMQFYLYCGWVGEVTGRRFSKQFWQRLDQMISFVELLAAGGPVPMFGDKDDGYVLDLGDEVYDISAYRRLYQALTGDSVDENSLAATLFPGAPGECMAGGSRFADAQGALEGRYFERAGYILLQGEGSPASISAFMDVAELGYGSIAAHGHADALSLALRVNGEEMLVDTGTYDYFSYPQWRNYFRSTAAHNTLEIDGQDQSEMSGPFMWENRARTTVDRVAFNSNGGEVIASHEGYSRLPGSPVHTRKVELDLERKLFRITDSIQSAQAHDIGIYFHFSEHCQIEVGPENSIRIKLEGFMGTMSFDSTLELEVIKGGDGERPGPGWRSHSYHEKVSITTVVARGRAGPGQAFDTRLEWY